MTRSPGGISGRAVLIGALLLVPIAVAMAIFLPQLKNVDLKELIRSVGYVGLWAIVFAESGLYFGFFLPGDSLLFTAGLLASSVAGELRVFDLAILIPSLA